MYFCVMKIIIAETAGFCMGVKRAVDLALEHAAKSAGGVHTLGPLIHNNQTIEMLRERNVVTLDESKPVPQDSTILVRAHGVPPGAAESWNNKAHIIDGTCPKVKTVHHVIEKYRSMGYGIVITGDEGHAEVIGLMGYAGEAGHLIDSTEAVDTLPDMEKLCLVSQTTFDNATFDEIALKIRELFSKSDIVVKKTICSATDRRQGQTRDLAARVEAMIVVGGKNSANTKRLAKIAREQGATTQWVETEDEIDWDKIANCKTVGITAGASTPNWMIKRIVDYLQFMDQTKKKTPFNRVRSAADLLSTLNIIVAAGAALTYYASCVLQGFSPSLADGTISFLYFLSMYLWNSLTSIESTQHLGIGRYRFYRSHKPLLYASVGICIVVLLLISSMQSKALFSLMLFSTFLGCVYHITIIPSFLKILFRYTRLKDVPTSRDLFVALAWGIVLTFIPQASRETVGSAVLTTLCFAFIFVLAYLRSLIFDLRDIEGDRIMGRETLVTFIGEKRAHKVILLGTVTACLLCAVSPFVLPSLHGSAVNSRFLFQILPMVYLYVFTRRNFEIAIRRTVYFNVFADGQFFIAGFAAFCSTLVN
jgi:(E)-4-hydroxy-3-methyl-but-2-enyl pyrophosphate reductase